MSAASSHPCRCVLLLVSWVFAVSSAQAQDSRVEFIRDHREEKSQNLTPHQRSFLEAALFKLEDSLLLERVLDPPRGFHIRLGGIGEGAGFGIGPAYRHNTDALDFKASSAVSPKRYFIAEASLRFPGTALDSAYVTRDGPFVELYARRRDFPQEDFFSLGPQSVEGDRSNFAMRDTLGRVTGGIRRGHFTIAVAGSHLDSSVGPGTDRRIPTTTDVPGAAGLPGFSEQPTFRIVEPFVEWTTLNRALEDHAGGRYRVSFSRYWDADHDRYSFRKWDVDLRQYIPFFHDTRTFALRAWMTTADADGGNLVPFYLQPTIGGARSLRGFRTFRFRDASAVLLQAEYRWRINALVSGALFYDTGAVGPRMRDLGSFERDYGFGLRIGSRNGVVMRADFAFGGESPRLLLRFDDVF
jgi:hypothetical protein